MPIKASVPKNRQGQNSRGSNSKWEYANCDILVAEERIKIMFIDKPIQDEDALGNPVSTFESVWVDIKDLPEFPHMPPAKTRIKGVKVRFDHENNKVIAINPARGSFEAHLNDIGPKSDDGSFPVFQTETDVPSQDGKGTYTRKSFWVGYTITKDTDNNGLFVGCKVAFYPHYKFYGREDGFTDVEGTQKAYRTTQLLHWLEAHRLADVDIKWPSDGNVLPELWRRLSKGEAPTDCRIKMDKGYVQDMEPLTYSALSVEPDDDVDDEPVVPVPADGEESRYDHARPVDPDFD